VLIRRNEMNESISNRKQWEETVKAKYPECKLDNTGTFIYATVNGKDVGFYSIVGNYGNIFD
jgi:hypothetical protein